MAIEYANSDPIKVTHTKGAMSDGQKYTNTLPWKVELTNDDLAYQEDIQNLQRQINALEADLTWRDPVETYEDLPASGNDDGDVRLVTSTGVLYVWAGSEWVALNESQDPIKELTEADYESGQNYVALWKLSTGFYHASNGIRTKSYSTASAAAQTALFTIVQLGTGVGSLIITYNWANYGAWGYPASYAFVSPNGSLHNNDTSAGYFLSSRHIVDDLTSTGTNLALSAKQGKILKDLADGNVGKAKVLTAADWNYPENNPDGIAVWLLPNGDYVGGNQKIYWSVTYPDPTPGNVGFSVRNGYCGYEWGKAIIKYGIYMNGGNIDEMSTFRYGQVRPNGQNYYGYSSAGDENGLILNTKYIADSLTNNYSKVALSAKQGKILNERIGNLTTLTTTDKTSAVAAINEIAANAPAVVQTTGTSTTDVMSQKAVTDNLPTTLTDAQYEALWSTPNALNVYLETIVSGEGV